METNQTTKSEEQLKREQQNTEDCRALGFTPTQDRLLIKPLDAETVTKGGIIIPDTAKEKPTRGVVVVAGPGFTDRPQTYQQGDTVIYSQYSGTDIKWQGEQYIMLRASDVMGHIDPDMDDPQKNPFK